MLTSIFPRKNVGNVSFRRASLLNLGTPNVISVMFSRVEEC